MQPLTVFLDEGALDGDARFPSACAVIFGSVTDATAQIENLIHELALQPDFELEPSSARFQQIGFHHVDDNFLAKQRFNGLLPRLDFEWWCSMNLDSEVEDPYTVLPDQFRWIVQRILQKYRERSIHFVFEQNERMRSKFPFIVQSAAINAKSQIDLVTYAVGTKNDRVLSVADYCIALASQAVLVWMEACCETKSLHKRHEYRSFAAVEPLCSTLFAANISKSLSNRAKRLGEQSYYEVTGSHSACCRHFREL